MPRYRAAMDIGGTFTDFVVIDDREQTTVTGKTSTTPAHPEQGVLSGLEQTVPDAGELSFVVHGTTVGLNAFLERKGTRVLLAMTTKLSDAYSIARHDRKELYTLRYRKPTRLVPRHDVYEVVERLRHDGSVDTELDIASLGPLVEAVRRDGIEAVAVCLVHSYVNPEHELRVRDELERECPGLSVTLSHEIAREWREYERASTAVMNAYVAPRVEDYLRNLESGLVELAVPAKLHVMQSNGGITTAAKARRQPIQTLLSGPVGGTIGGAALSRRLPEEREHLGRLARIIAGRHQLLQAARVRLPLEVRPVAVDRGESRELEAEPEHDLGRLAQPGGADPVAGLGPGPRRRGAD